jgi:5-dehydro-2-deoxygluconokinase
MSEALFPTRGARALDLLCLGRVGVDLYAQQEGVALEAVQSFRKSVGGSAGNVATGAARLGLRTGMISAVSDDGFGRYVRDFLASNGVDVSGVKTDTTGALNSLALTEFRPDGCKVIIYRRDAADLRLSPRDIDPLQVASARALLVTGTALSASPSREACLYAMTLARKAGTTVVFDMDYRPYGWESVEQASVYLQVASAMADVVIGNREEFDVLDLQDSACGEGAKRLLKGHTRVVLLKDGARGCMILRRGEPTLEQGVFAVTARKPFGSGDAFASATLWGVFEGRSWEGSARLGAASAAMVVSGVACAESMPTRAALLAFVAEHTLSIA